MSPVVAILRKWGAPRDEGGELSRDEEGRVRWGKRAAGLLIRRGDGRILLVKRSQDVMDPGLWGIPGGRVEPGESEWAGAISEAEEELGGLPEVHRAGETVYRSGGFAYTTYLVEVEEGAAEAMSRNVALNWENSEWGWFSPEALPSPVHPNVKALL